jgi:hypothetical protein
MRPLLLAVLLLALIPTAASAWTGVPPGDRPARNTLVDQAVAIGQDFWHDRNVGTCPTTRLNVRFADDLSDGKPWQAAYGRGQMNGCKIWLLTSLVRRAQSGRPGNDWVAYLCSTVVMELGHTGGLDDFANDGAMTPGAPYAKTPYACRRWGRERREHQLNVMNLKADSELRH